ncbi:MAG: hypothetical protein Q7S00_01130, partial [bacterium]|nr:hypothetical protein [bacterium]
KKGYGSAVKTVSFSSNQPRVSLFLPLSETPLIRTHFTATPYAAVSIVGQFLNQETPFLRSLAPEKYEVQFFHEPSGRQVSAVLEGGQGGSFLCSADMRLNDQKGKPTAVCHKE